MKNNNNQLGYFIGGNFLTIIVDRSYSVNRSDSRYSLILEALKERRWQDVLDLLDKPAAIARYSQGQIAVFENEVQYNGVAIRGQEVNRILQFMREGLPIEPLVAFLNNLYLNTDVAIRERLYLFLENNNLAITERGSFLAFKLAGEDGRPYYNRGSDDGYGNELVYELGREYTYPKERIVKTTGECSTEGLYVGNRNYWNSSFNEAGEYTGDGKMFVVEVFPQDVENVPHADATKIVVSRLKVVALYATARIKATASLYSDDDLTDMFEKLPRFARDDNGRFVSSFQAPKQQFSFKRQRRDAQGRFLPPRKMKRDSSGRFVG